MKAIILAAGKGSRLGFTNLPKPLTPLANGRSILANQLDRLKGVLSLDQVLVVVGYHKEAIMEACPGLTFVYCPSFAVENTSKSLLQALKKVDDDALWLNGDVVFHRSVLERILEEKTTSMVVNKGPVDQEEVKYRTNGQGRILEVSKEVAVPEGEALGINFAAKKDVKQLIEALEESKDTDFFEKGIEKCIQKGMLVRAVTVEADKCTEVDFPEDLERANALLRLWGD